MQDAFFPLKDEKRRPTWQGLAAFGAGVELFLKGCGSPARFDDGICEIRRQAKR